MAWTSERYCARGDEGIILQDAGSSRGLQNLNPSVLDNVGHVGYGQTRPCATQRGGWPMLCSFFKGTRDRETQRHTAARSPAISSKVRLSPSNVALRPVNSCHLVTAVST